MMKLTPTCFSALLLLMFITSCQSSNIKESPLLNVLILDGHNNHYVWPKTSWMMKDYLEETKLFKATIHRPDTVWLGIKYQPNRAESLTSFIEDYPLKDQGYTYAPEPLKTVHYAIPFHQYDVVILNLGEKTPTWSQEMQHNFENYMKQGGGLIVVHAANNAWGDWPAFNKMIGLGAWGGRNSTSGPYVYYDEETKEIQKDYRAGICGSHGAEYEYLVSTRAPEHPIMKGFPKHWLHAKDELYERMRGPFEQATVLATAFADEEKNVQTWAPTLRGSGKHVPMMMAINYGKGRIFHTTQGHFDYSMECVGFITLLQRGAEWVATGKVTQVLPTDLPSKNKTSTRTWKR